MSDTATRNHRMRMLTPSETITRLATPETGAACPVRVRSDLDRCVSRYISPRGRYKIFQHYQQMLERRSLGKYHRMIPVVKDWEAEASSKETDAAARARAREMISLAVTSLLNGFDAAMLASTALNTTLQPFARMMAIDELGDTGTPEAVDALIGMITVYGWNHFGLDEHLRKAVVVALGRAKARRAVPDLVVRLEEDGSLAVRCAAAWAIGETADAAAVPFLHAALSSEDVALRIHAAKALGNFPGEANAHVLVAMLDDPVRDVRMAALDALTKVAPHVDAPESFVRHLVSKKTLQTPPRHAWEGRRYFERARGADALGALKNDAGVEPLIRLLSDRQAYVVLRAARALAAIGSAKAISGLYAFFTKKNARRAYNSDIRHALMIAARAISKHGDASKLIAMLGDVSKESLHGIIKEALAAAGKRSRLNGKSG